LKETDNEQLGNEQALGKYFNSLNLLKSIFYYNNKFILRLLGTKKAFLDLLLQLQEETGDGSLKEQDIVYEVSTFMYAVSV